MILREFHSVIISNFRRIILVFSLIILIVNGSNGQDVHFSQYYATPAFLNPAMASVERNMYFGINYRTQWQNLDFPYKTFQFTFMHPVFMEGAEKVQVGGLGLSVFNDEAGENSSYRTSGVLLSASYNLRLDRQGNQLIAFGLQGGYTQKSINLGELQWGSQYNPIIGFDNTIIPDTDVIEENVSYATINTGIIYYFNPNRQYYFKKFSGFAGVAVSYLNRPNESLIRGNIEEVPMLYKIHGGMEFKLNRQLYFSPNVLFMHQGTSDEVNFGAYTTYEFSNYTGRSNPKDLSMVLGTWYRLNDSFIFSLGLSAKSLSFGFSYDMNVSSIRQSFSGLSAYELSLAYRVSKTQGVRRFSSPLF